MNFQKFIPIGIFGNNCSNCGKESNQLIKVYSVISILGWTSCYGCRPFINECRKYTLCEYTKVSEMYHVFPSGQQIRNEHKAAGHDLGVLIPMSNGGVSNGTVAP